MQGLAGIAGKVADDGQPHPIIHKLLQNLSGQAGAEHKKGLRKSFLVDGHIGAAGFMVYGHNQIQRRLGVKNQRLRTVNHSRPRAAGFNGLNCHGASFLSFSK
ncbi:hypothetical protein SDC9_75717 [bioreactor metagenome]|uniref:Uncharacterized protein n=1 Tax=bioreactor metagenome TaxID=1076179 RepID=A0A644YLJ2_9ZZZZ